MQQKAHPYLEENPQQQQQQQQQQQPATTSARLPAAASSATTNVSTSAATSRGASPTLASAARRNSALANIRTELELGSARTTTIGSASGGNRSRLVDPNLTAGTPLPASWGSLRGEVGLLLRSASPDTADRVASIMARCESELVHLLRTPPGTARHQEDASHVAVSSPATQQSAASMMSTRPTGAAGHPVAAAAAAAAGRVVPGVAKGMIKVPRLLCGGVTSAVSDLVWQVTPCSSWSITDLLRASIPKHYHILQQHSHSGDQLGVSGDDQQTHRSTHNTNQHHNRVVFRLLHTMLRSLFRNATSSADGSSSVIKSAVAGSPGGDTTNLSAEQGAALPTPSSAAAAAQFAANHHGPCFVSSENTGAATVRCLLLQNPTQSSAPPSQVPLFAFVHPDGAAVMATVADEAVPFQFYSGCGDGSLYVWTANVNVHHSHPQQQANQSSEVAVAPAGANGSDPAQEDHLCRNTKTPSDVVRSAQQTPEPVAVVGDAASDDSYNDGDERLGIDHVASMILDDDDEDDMIYTDERDLEDHEDADLLMGSLTSSIESSSSSVTSCSSGGGSSLSLDDDEDDESSASARAPLSGADDHVDDRGEGRGSSSSSDGDVLPKSTKPSNRQTKPISLSSSAPDKEDDASTEFAVSQLLGDDRHNTGGAAGTTSSTTRHPRRHKHKKKNRAQQKGRTDNDDDDIIGLGLPPPVGLGGSTGASSAASAIVATPTKPLPNSGGSTGELFPLPLSSTAASAHRSNRHHPKHRDEQQRVIDGEVRDDTVFLTCRTEEDGGGGTGGDYNDVDVELGTPSPSRRPSSSVPVVFGSSSLEKHKKISASAAAADADWVETMPERKGAATLNVTRVATGAARESPQKQPTAVSPAHTAEAHQCSFSVSSKRLFGVPSTSLTQQGIGGSGRDSITAMMMFPRRAGMGATVSSSSNDNCDDYDGSNSYSGDAPSGDHRCKRRKIGCGTRRGRLFIIDTSITSSDDTTAATTDGVDGVIVSEIRSSGASTTSRSSSRRGADNGGWGARITSWEAVPEEPNLSVAATAHGQLLLIDSRMEKIAGEMRLPASTASSTSAASGSASTSTPRVSLTQANGRGLCCAHALPISSTLLLSGGDDRRVRLWDIRKLSFSTSSPLASKVSTQQPISAVSDLSGNVVRIASIATHNPLYCGAITFAAVAQQNDRMSILKVGTAHQLTIVQTVTKLHSNSMISTCAALPLLPTPGTIGICGGGSGGGLTYSPRKDIHARSSSSQENVAAGLMMSSSCDGASEEGGAAVAPSLPSPVSCVPPPLSPQTQTAQLGQREVALLSGAVNGAIGELRFAWPH